jgi:hypothetical protein
VSRLGVALVAAAAFLGGVLLVAILGGAKNVVHEKTVTAPAVVTGGGGSGTTGTAVPDLVGQPLDVARDALDQAGLDSEEIGAGVLGVIVPGNWEVVDQSPGPGETVDEGSTVQLEIQHR